MSICPLGASGDCRVITQLATAEMIWGEKERKGCYEEKKQYKIEGFTKVEGRPGWFHWLQDLVLNQEDSTITPVILLLTLKEQIAMACKYDTTFHSKAIKTSSETIGHIARERSLISKFGVMKGLSFLGLVPYPLPTFVAGYHANTESLTHFPSCINSTVSSVWVYLRYIKSVNSNDKKAYFLSF